MQKFSLQYQCIAKQTSEENTENYQLENTVFAQLLKVAVKEIYGN